MMVPIASTPLVAEAFADEIAKLAEAVKLLAESSVSQSNAMLALARSTAESMRLAAGSYIFQLRDRFDELLPSVAVGAPEAQWTVEQSPGPIDQLVFHPGDRATIEIRLALSQCPIRRIVNTTWITAPIGDCDIIGPRYTAANGIARSDRRYQLDADCSLFVDFSLSVNVGNLQPGGIEERATIRIDCTDTRPEGAVASVLVDIVYRAIVVTDDDGVGLDIPTVETTVREERRTYWLDKDEALPLQLPRLQ